MKKLFAILAGFALLLALGGCNFKENSLELKDRSIIGTLGIDIGGDNQYTVTVLTFNSDISGGDGEFSCEYFESAGETLRAAVAGLTQKAYRIPFFGHNSVIVLGRNAANTALCDIVDYIVQNPDMRLDANLFIAESAADIVRAKTSDAAVAAGSIEAILNNRPAHRDYRLTVFDIMKVSQNGSFNGYVPYIHIAAEQGAAGQQQEKSGAQQPQQGEEQPEQDKIEINSLALFKSSIMVQLADGRVQDGVLLAYNKIDEMVIDLDVLGKKACVSLKQLTLNCTVSDAQSFIVDAALIANVSYELIDAGLIDSPKLAEAVTAGLEDYYRELVSLTLKGTAQMIDCDLFELRWRYSAYDKAWADGFSDSELFEKTRLQFSIHLNFVE